MRITNRSLHLCPSLRPHGRPGSSARSCRIEARVECLLSCLSVHSSISRKPWQKVPRIVGMITPVIQVIRTREQILRAALQDRVRVLIPCIDRCYQCVHDSDGCECRSGVDGLFLFFISSMHAMYVWLVHACVAENCVVLEGNFKKALLDFFCIIIIIIIVISPRHSAQ
jgi:hypothetical protein